ncbi:MAG: poly-gamma-glutamate synthase PgsB [Acidobacteriota bacterium]
MPSFFILLALVVLLLVAAALEFRRHQRQVESIPHRIHINGTRGKSSVTRLVGAGLRAGGVATITKVTGTFPRLILDDGSDVPVHRKAAPSILEQLSIIDFARQRSAEALVIECMALEPTYQRITEHQMIHATLPVLVNVRLDHTDVMGRTLEEVGAAMANTIPAGSRVLTAEQENLALVKRLAKERGAEAVPIAADSVAAEDLAGFGYIEHRENVALALAVCAELGVPREVALQGMWRARPDAGVLTRSSVSQGYSVVHFFNAFAANDPESSLTIWRKLASDGLLTGQRCVLLNSRPDRKERSEQLAQLVAEHLAVEVAAIFVMGEPTDVVTRRLRSLGVAADKIFDLGHAGPETVFEAILSLDPGEISVVAIGNMGGEGAKTVDWFEKRSRSRG